MGTKKIVALRPARHTRLSRLNSASDVAGRDHVVAHPDRASMATTRAGQRVIIGGRLRTFARALGLPWRRRSQEPRRRLIDGGWRCVTHGRQQFSGFLEAEDGGFDVRVRIMTLSHQPGLRGRRQEPQESAGEVLHAHRHVAMRQQGWREPGRPPRRPDTRFPRSAAASAASPAAGLLFLPLLALDRQQVLLRRDLDVLGVYSRRRSNPRPRCRDASGPHVCPACR